MGIFVGIIILIAGIILISFPEFVYEISEGWRYENLEPSDTYFDAMRLKGVLAVAVGIGVTFYNIVN